MEKILKQPQFDKYSTLLYNSIWLSDQNKIVLVYHATISFSIKTFFAFALKIKKILRQQGGRHSPLSSFALFQFLFQTRDLVKASFKEQFSINIGIRNFSAKTVKNKPKHPKPKPKPKQKKAKHKTTSSKPITKDLTECEADMQLADFLTKRKKKKRITVVYLLQKVVFEIQSQEHPFKGESSHKSCHSPKYILATWYH